MIISYDKMNQLRHVRFLKDMQGVEAHMEKHRAIVAPKFEAVWQALREGLSPMGKLPLDNAERRLFHQPVHAGRVRKAHRAAV